MEDVSVLDVTQILGFAKHEGIRVNFAQGSGDEVVVGGPSRWIIFNLVQNTPTAHSQQHAPYLHKGRLVYKHTHALAETTAAPLLLGVSLSATAGVGGGTSTFFFGNL